MIPPLRHVFFVQMEPDIDQVTPIIYKLATTTQSHITVICINALYNLKQDYRIQFLDTFNSVSIVFIDHFLWTFWKFRLARYLCLLPATWVRKIPQGVWSRLYFKQSVLSQAHIQKILKKTRTHTITADISISKVFQINFIAAAKTMQLPLIFMQTGNVTLKIKENALFSDYMDSIDKIIPNTLRYPDNKTTDNKVHVLGCARFNNEWQDINHQLLIKAFPCIPNESNRRKLKILMFGLGWINFDAKHHLAKQIKELDFVDLIFKDKPRVNKPSKVFGIDANAIPSTRLIHWADIVISPMTSMVFDILYYQKPFLYLKYLMPNESATFEDYGACIMIHSQEALLDYIHAIYQNKVVVLTDKENIAQYIKNAVYLNKENYDVLKAYVDFYQQCGLEVNSS